MYLLYSAPICPKDNKIEQETLKFPTKTSNVSTTDSRESSSYCGKIIGVEECNIPNSQVKFERWTKKIAKIIFSKFVRKN